MNSPGRESLSPETHVDYQNSSAFHLDPSVVDRFNMLNLSQSAPNSAAARRYKRLNRQRTRGSLKKRSSSSYQEPSTASEATDPSSRNSLSSSSRRTPETTCYQDFSNTAKAMNQVYDCPMPGNFKKADNLPVSQSRFFPIGASISPVPLPLFRCFSDPISSDHQQVEFTTPPRPGPLSRSRSSDQETPNSKKLKKFQQKMEELWQWMGKIVQEEEQDTAHLQNNGIVNKEQGNIENQETVCVKKTEEGLTLHFKCPCGGGYEVFLSGDKCFYRLT